MSNQMPLPHLKNMDVNNNTTLKKYTDGVTIILFYMPGCGWCQKFKPAFLDAVKEADKNVNFVAVDISSEDGSLLQNKINSVEKPKFIVRGAPKVVGYKNGKFYAVYAQGNKDTFRTKDDVLMFAKGIKNNVKVEIDPQAAS